MRDTNHLHCLGLLHKISSPSLLNLETLPLHHDDAGFARRPCRLRQVLSLGAVTFVKLPFFEHLLMLYVFKLYFVMTLVMFTVCFVKLYGLRFVPKRYLPILVVSRMLENLQKSSLSRVISWDILPEMYVFTSESLWEKIAFFLSFFLIFLFWTVSHMLDMLSCKKNIIIIISYYHHIFPISTCFYTWNSHTFIW